MSDNDIHMSDNASQPDVQRRCVGDWSTPSWKNTPAYPPQVYLSSAGWLYTFYESKATCVACRAMPARAYGQ